MSGVPVTISGVVYPKNKKDPPYPVTIMGFAEITGLGVGGGPVLPPDVIPPVEPPLVIWPPIGGPELPPYPDNTLPEIPPVPTEPPPAAEAPHEGWNWSAEHSGWYFLYIPGEGEASPKKKR